MKSPLFTNAGEQYVALINPQSSSSDLGDEHACDAYDHDNHNDLEHSTLHNRGDRKSRSSIGSAIASESQSAQFDIDPRFMRSNSQGEPVSHSQRSLDSKHGMNDTLETAEKLSSNNQLASIPWVMFFTQSASLVLLLCHWTYAWIGFMLLNQLPTFLTDELGYDIETAGALSVVPYIANFVSTIMFAMIFDYAEVKLLNL